MADVAMERGGRGATGSRVVQRLILFFCALYVCVDVFVYFWFLSTFSNNFCVFLILIQFDNHFLCIFYFYSIIVRDFVVHLFN